MDLSYGPVMRCIPAVALALFTAATCAQERVYLRVERSAVTLVSDAPMERITATNSKSSGLLDPVARSFAVQVPVVEFQGFNSPLQREHFNENYMESRKWPNATFQGRIIETIDLSVPGSHAVRAKGKLTIHGVEQERIVPCKLVVAPDGVRVTARFDVPLEDHDIRVPRVVQQKISSIIDVQVDVVFRNSTRRP